jgi:His-Xaa-Ser system protein HxsD
MAEVVVSFSIGGQSDGPLRDAAYRMAAMASCHVDLVDGRWTCTLQPTPDAGRRGLTDAALRDHILNVVNDENLRDRLGDRTEGLRNVIVALAFGALARAEATPEQIRRTADGPLPAH